MKIQSSNAAAPWSASPQGSSTASMGDGFFTGHPLAAVYEVRLSHQQAEAALYRQEAQDVLGLLNDAASSLPEVGTALQGIDQRLKHGVKPALPTLDRATYHSDIVASRRDTATNLADGFADYVTHQRYIAAGSDSSGGGSRPGRDSVLYASLAPEAEQVTAALTSAISQVIQFSAVDAEQAVDASARLDLTKPLVGGLAEHLGRTLHEVSERALLVTSESQATRYPADRLEGFEAILAQAQRLGQQGRAGSLLHHVPMPTALSFLAS